MIELEERNIQHQIGGYAGSIEGNVRRENIVNVLAWRSQVQHGKEMLTSLYLVCYVSIYPIKGVPSTVL